MRFVLTRRDGVTRGRELGLFAALFAISLGVNEAVMWMGVELAGGHRPAVKVAATAAVMVWNFWSRKRWLDAGCV